MLLGEIIWSKQERVEGDEGEVCPAVGNKDFENCHGYAINHLNLTLVIPKDQADRSCCVHRL